MRERIFSFVQWMADFFMATIGFFLGLAAASVSITSEHPILSIMLFLPVFAIFGMVAAGVVSLTYRILLPSGVSLPRDTGLISPDNFGMVAFLHLSTYSKALGVGIALVVADQFLKLAMGSL